MSKKTIELIGDPKPQLLHHKCTYYSLESIFKSNTPWFLEEFIERIDQMRQELEEKGWSNLCLSLESGYGRSEITFFGSRLENTEEIERRLARKEVETAKLAKKIQKAKDFLKSCGELDD